MVVVEGDRAAVRGHDPAGDRETEPGSLARPAGIDPVEALEHLLAFCRGDAGTVVGHLQDQAPVAPGAFDLDRPRLRSVPQRVVDQDHHQLLEAIRVDQGPPDPRARELDPGMARAGERLHVSRRRSNQLVDVRLHRVDLGLARVDARQREHAADQPAHALGLVAYGVQDLSVLGHRLIRVAKEDLDTGVDDRQRRSQLVRGVRGELLLALEGAPYRYQGPAGQEPGGGQDQEQRPRAGRGHREGGDPLHVLDRLQGSHRLEDPSLHERLGVDEDVLLAPQANHRRPRGRFPGRHRLGPQLGGRKAVGVLEHVPAVVPGDVDVAVPVRDAVDVVRVHPVGVAHQRRLLLGHQLVVHQEDDAGPQGADHDGHGDHVGDQEAPADPAEDHGRST